MRAGRDRCCWVAALLCCAAACGPSTGAKPANAEASAAQPAEPLPRDRPPAEVLPLAAKRYAAGWVVQGKPIAGKLAQGERSDHLLVLEAGRCYRVVGVGGEGVEDMDLFLYDPAGVQANQDASTDRYPVLGKTIEICPIRSGAYRLQAQMYKGGGELALGVYRTP